MNYRLKYRNDIWDLIWDEDIVIVEVYCSIIIHIYICINYNF